MSSRTVGMIAVSVVLWVAAGYRFHSYRRTANRGSRELALALALLGAATFAYAPAIYRALDRHLFRRPNTSELVGHLAILFSATAAVGMVVSLSYRTRRWLLTMNVATACVSVAMAGDFLSHRFPIETTDFTSVYGNAADVRAYWTMFLSYVGALLIVLAILTLRPAPAADLWLKRGLRMVGIGALAGLVYLAQWTGYLLAQAAGRDLPTAVTRGALIFALTGVILIGLGTATPALGPRVRATVARRRLRPLWQELTDRHPNVRLRPDTFADPLLRMVVEIRDAAYESRLAGSADDPVVDAVLNLPARPLTDLHLEVRSLESVAAQMEERSRRVG